MIIDIEAIRERHAKGIGDGDPYAVVTTSARDAHNDRRALLAYVDTLRLKVGVQGRLLRLLSRRRIEQSVTAANLLAHRHAMWIRVGAVALSLSDERETWLASFRVLRRERDEARAELARKDAEIQRLRGVLRDVQSCEERGRCDHLPPGDHAGVIRAALGEEVRDDAI